MPVFFRFRYLILSIHWPTPSSLWTLPLSVVGHKGENPAVSNHWGGTVRVLCLPSLTIVAIGRLSCSVFFYPLSDQIFVLSLTWVFLFSLSLSFFPVRSFSIFYDIFPLEARPHFLFFQKKNKTKPPRPRIAVCSFRHGTQFIISSTFLFPSALLRCPVLPPFSSPSFLPFNCPCSVWPLTVLPPNGGYPAQPTSEWENPRFCCRAVSWFSAWSGFGPGPPSPPSPPAPAQ